jgi:cleavage stimulation factor subunit 3
VNSNTGKYNANSVVKSEAQQSLGTNVLSSQPQQSNSLNKRPSSPDPRRREESRTASEYGPPPKRPRPGSPARGHDRDRWDSSGRRRYGSPSPWERERERDASHSRRYDKEREEDRSVTLPPILSWFIGTLPGPNSFDGVSPYLCTTSMPIRANVP